MKNLTILAALLVLCGCGGSETDARDETPPATPGGAAVVDDVEDPFAPSASPLKARERLMGDLEVQQRAANERRETMDKIFERR